MKISKKLPQNVGWLDIQLDDKHIDHLWDCIKTARGESAKSILVGQIEKSYQIFDKDDIFWKEVILRCIDEYGNALLSHLMIKRIEKEAVAVGGLTLGADPLVCGIAQKAYYKGNRHIDALIIRKNPKGYGTKEVIEGNKPAKGSVVTVLEDVTTTGGSAMTAVNVLRDAGYVVNRVVTIVDRMDDHKIWDDNNIEFQSLFQLFELT